MGLLTYKLPIEGTIIVFLSRFAIFSLTESMSSIKLPSVENEKKITTTYYKGKKQLKRPKQKCSKMLEIEWNGYHRISSLPCQSWLSINKKTKKAEGTQHYFLDVKIKFNMKSYSKFHWSVILFRIKPWCQRCFRNQRKKFNFENFDLSPV